MGRTARIKGDLDDVEAILEIISILKDVSTNRFFSFAQQKEDFAKFLELFLIFFNMLESVETDCPLVRNNYTGMDLVVITSESSFMAQLNSKVCSAAARELEKNPHAQVVCVGYRGADRMRSLGIKLAKVYDNIEKTGRYQVALAVRDYLIDRIMSGESGKAICVYVWAKSFNILKPRSVKLLPAEELLAAPEDEKESGGAILPAFSRSQKFIAESSIDGLMKVLADIWVSCRLFEMISDSLLAEAAAQAQQLESAMEGLSKEKKGLVLSFKKAGRGDLNKAMREVFTSSRICRKR
ncbi:MAG: F0F1 ATP synthase subunit gamma [Candidatus Omnitrophica bacterium]|nr:F0F1 ATP synthase subunit gamma [Candidatus Omnitrophota bacterium]